MTEERPPGPGLAMLVVPMPGSVRPPTDSAAAMIAWLSVHGAPRTAEVLRRLQRHAWAIEPPDSDCRHPDRAVGHRSLRRRRAGARRGPPLPRTRERPHALGARRPARRGDVAAVRRAARALSGPGLGGAHGGRKPGPRVPDPRRTGHHKPRLRASWLRSRASCSGAVRVRSSSMCSSSRTARR